MPLEKKITTFFQELQDERAFRIQRALHCSMMKTVLPKVCLFVCYWWLFAPRTSGPHTRRTRRREGDTSCSSQMISSSSSAAPTSAVLANHTSAAPAFAVPCLLLLLIVLHSFCTYSPKTACNLSYYSSYNGSFWSGTCTPTWLMSWRRRRRRRPGPRVPRGPSPRNLSSR